MLSAEHAADPYRRLVLRLLRLITAFVVISPILTRGTHGITTSVAWCEALLEKEHVALVAGSAFGAEGNVRMSFASSEEKLERGLDRIARFVGA
jgi:aspartate/methionine/tyrosine aminotransferase